MSVSSIVDKIWLRNEIDKVVNSIIQDDFEEASYDVKGDFRFIVLVDRTANIYELYSPTNEIHT